MYPLLKAIQLITVKLRQQALCQDIMWRPILTAVWSSTDCRHAAQKKLLETKIATANETPICPSDLVKNFEITKDSVQTAVCQEQQETIQTTALMGCAKVTLSQSEAATWTAVVGKESITKREMPWDHIKMIVASVQCITTGLMAGSTITYQPTGARDHFNVTSSQPEVATIEAKKSLLRGQCLKPTPRQWHLLLEKFLRW